jgi:V/A-type H+-transporting ATPase subunit E
MAATGAGAGIAVAGGAGAGASVAGLERIKEKILAEARAQADESLRAAREQAGAIVREAEEDAARQAEAILARAERDAAALQRRLVSVAELEGRKKRLSAKQGLIGELFAEAIARLNALPPDEYEKLLVGMIAASASGGEEVIISERDAGRVSGGFIGAANKALEARGGAGGLALSGERRDIGGGFVLRAGEIEINNSFRSIAKTQSDSLEALAVKMLFAPA